MFLVDEFVRISNISLCGGSQLDAGNSMGLPLGLTLVLAPLSFIIVFLNIIICFLVILNKNLRTYTNGFIVSLGVSDLLFGGFFLPIYIHDPQNKQVTGFITALVLFTNVSNLCALTAERFLALTRPMQYRYLISKYFKVMISLAWVLPIVISALPFCWSSTASPLFQDIYLYSTMFIFAFLPYIFIIVTYVFLFRAVRQRRRDMHKLASQKGKNEKVSSTEVKVAKVFFIIAILFAASWLPIVYMTTCMIFKREDLIPSELERAHTFILAFNAMYNPILYAFMKPDFKNALKKLLGRGNKRRECGTMRSTATADVVTETQNLTEATKV